jgi:hypothetical protein
MDSQLKIRDVTKRKRGYRPQILGSCVMTLVRLQLPQDMPAFATQLILSLAG